MERTTYENDPDVNEGTDIFMQIIDHARSIAVANPDIPDDLPLWINEDDIIRAAVGGPTTTSGSSNI